LHQLRMLLFDTRIDVVADVAVPPSIESAVFQGGEIVRRQVVAEFVSLVDASPKFSRRRIKSQPHRIPQPCCILPRILPIRITNRYRGTNGGLEIGRASCREGVEDEEE